MSHIEKLNKVSSIFGYISFCLIIILISVYLLISNPNSDSCYKEVVDKIWSPDGYQNAIITIKDCGGATTDFYGSVSVDSRNKKLVAKKLITFEGRPEEAGIRLKWANDNHLIIYISDLYRIRKINPNGRSSSSLKVEYIYDKK